MIEEKQFKYQLEKELGGENINMFFNGQEAKCNINASLSAEKLRALLKMGLTSIKRSGAGLHLKFNYKQVQNG